MERYSVGDPMDESIKCGPMVSESQQKSVSEYISLGISEGATLVYGGEGLPDGINSGFFVKPTVFADVTADITQLPTQYNATSNTGALVDNPNTGGLKPGRPFAP